MPVIDFDTLFAFAALLIGVVIALDVYLTLQYVRKLLGKTPLPHVPTPRIAKGENAGNKIINVLWKLRYVTIHVAFLGVAVYILYLALSPLPTIQTAYPAADSNWNDYSQPITIVFNEPVQINKLRPNLSVESLQGEWKYDKYLGFLPVTRVAKFYPANTLLPDQRIVVYMTGIARWGVNENNEHALNFFSQKEPEVMSTDPLNNATEVDVNKPLIFRLTSANQPYDKWEFEITPKIDFQTETPDPYTFLLKPTKALAQSQSYTVSAVDLL